MQRRRDSCGRAISLLQVHSNRRTCDWARRRLHRGRQRSVSYVLQPGRDHERRALSASGKLQLARVHSEDGRQRALFAQCRYRASPPNARRRFRASLERSSSSGARDSVTTSLRSPTAPWKSIAMNSTAGSIQLETSSSLDLRLNNDYSSRWYGVSFAAQATKKTSLGFTAFVAQQRGFYSEDIGIAVGGTLDETGLRVGGDSVTSNTSLSVRNWDIVLRLGALHRFNSRWQLGIVFQTPGIPVGRKGSVFRRLTSAVSRRGFRLFSVRSGRPLHESTDPLGASGGFRIPGQFLDDALGGRRGRRSGS